MFYFYDTYMSWYNWYYNINTNKDSKEELVTRVIEMDEEGRVLDDTIVNTTTDGEQIIPTISIGEIKSSADSSEDTKTISEFVKQYCVETNYRLRGKKHNR